MFNDDAEFCNNCGIALLADNSRSIYDDEKLRRTIQLRLNAIRQCKMLLIGLIIFAPFSLLFMDFAMLDSTIKKATVVTLLETLSVIGVLLLGKAEKYVKQFTKNYPPSNYILFGIGIVSLIMSPIGLIPGAIVFWYTIRINAISISE